MNSVNAFHYDKFQTASILTAEAILGHFRSVHHLAVLNLCYSANQVIFDIATRYTQKTGKSVSSSFQKTLPKSSDEIMSEMRPSANFIKHADRDWLDCRKINSMYSWVYLGNLCMDYVVLRNALFVGDFIKKHPESSIQIPGLSSRSRVDLLVEVYVNYVADSFFPMIQFPGKLTLKEAHPDFSIAFDIAAKKRSIIKFLSKNGLDVATSGGLPDYYMTKVARPIFDSSDDKSNPRPHVG